MDNGLEKKYGLTTAICMVVGIVIGSGVFFKAEAVLNKTGGNMPLGILAWLLVGAIMIVCSYVFATLANRYGKASGLVDYAEATVGPRYAYQVGWFMATIYTPCLVATLAYVSARYFCVLLGWDTTGGACMTVAGFFLCMSHITNALAPRVAGKLQVGTTVAKMIPLALMAVVGTIAGLGNGQLVENFTTVQTALPAGPSLMAACVAVAFAYEGWVLATSINAELKDAKRNLPLALMLGACIVVVTYILYYIGLGGAVSTSALMASGQEGVKMAFQHMFGQSAGTLVFVLIVVSCLGGLNGMTLSCCRGFYALAARGEGPTPALLGQVAPVSSMPVNSAFASLGLSYFWLLYYYGANLDFGWFGRFNFDSSELPVITIYAMYIPMFIQLMRKGTDLNALQRFITPVLGIGGCIFMVYASLTTYGSKVFYYLVVYALFAVVGQFFYRSKEKINKFFHSISLDTVGKLVYHATVLPSEKLMVQKGVAGTECVSVGVNTSFGGPPPRDSAAD